MSIEGVKVTKEANVELKIDGTETQVNQYRILQSLGTGGFSEVFLCEDRYRKVQYAMKIMSKSFLRRKKEFFRIEGSRRPGIKTALDDVEREIALMKKISHPSIVKFYELIDDRTGDSMYLVLELLTKGQVMYWNNTVNKYELNSKAFTVTSDNTLTTEQTKKILIEIVQGLQYLHRNKIIHRDLKPENILISSSGIAKITDFGVSQQLAAQTSDALQNNTNGTPWFMSPELIKPPEDDMENANETEFLSDIWSLGVCLHAFLFGSLPFFDPVIEKQYAQVLSVPFTLSQQRKKKLLESKELEQILSESLEKTVEKRINLKSIVERLGVITEECDSVEITPTPEEIETAVTVKIELLTIIRLKLFVRKWRKRAMEKRKLNALLSSGSQTIETTSQPSVEVKAQQKARNLCICSVF